MKTGVGIAIGVALGAAMKNIPIGLCLGVALGVALDAIDKRKQENNKGGQQPPSGNM
jgi:hypothetical protein